CAIGSWDGDAFNFW
nr:immunoglobulin heavy chain junction region [Macaca mulatta]MOY19347.1 immunoglobulin heavy chain junction region [Macaca mulatta]MOY19895.1 immunoglobulin heavy chain junction region [Macaca mulatta]